MLSLHVAISLSHWVLLLLLGASTALRQSRSRDGCNSVPFVAVSVYGFFQVDIFYFPMVMLAISTVLSGSIPWPTLVGMLAGHLFWFLTVLHPRNRGTGSLIKASAAASS